MPLILNIEGREIVLPDDLTPDGFIEILTREFSPAEASGGMPADAIRATVSVEPIEGAVSSEPAETSALISSEACTDG